MSPCDLWTGTIDQNGYGYRGNVYVHREAYEAVHGPIPEGLILDHLCHTEDLSCPGGPACLHRRCRNPEHLEPVTRAENAKRGGKARWTECIHGHAFTPENTYVRKEGRRICRTCRRDRLRARRLIRG